MDQDQKTFLCDLINKIGGTAIGFAAITIPFAIVVWPITTNCEAATGHTVCQVR